MRGGGIPALTFTSQQEWYAWLAANHATATGVWLRLAKAGCAAPSVSYQEAVEAALCHGWIDAQKKSDDQEWWLQKFTPRASKSIWSKINREKALALLEQGHMQPAGLREMERAQQDGRWESAYDSPSRAAVPADFQAALDRNRRAREMFGRLDSGNRYAFLFRIHTAKKAETRAKRIQLFVDMLAKGEKIHPGRERL
jgi:uncharacterized protein YdeI (YjbR/CyaY-like superfamily)